MELKMAGLKVDGGGEGSKGGRVIGHTSSGKPVYAGHSNPAHKEFTGAEHHSAAKVHEKERNKLNDHMERLNSTANHATPARSKNTLRKIGELARGGTTTTSRTPNTWAPG